MAGSPWDEARAVVGAPRFVIRDGVGKLWAFAFALVAGHAAAARANPFELLGLTSRHAAQANAGAATADDAAALYYDPAGLAASPGKELSIGVIGAHAFLAVGDGHASLVDGYGAQLAMRAPVPLAGAWANRIVVGVALHLLPRDVARIVAPAPDAPAYPWYGDRLARVVVIPGAAVRFGDFAVGAGVNVLAGLDGTIAATEGAARAIDARVDERVPTVARVVAGATWQLAPSLRVGAVYRQRFEIPFATSAKTMVAGEPIDLDLRAAGQFTPHTFVAGVGWWTAPLVLSLDVGYALWSGYPGPYVRVDSQLPLVGPVPGQPPSVDFRDTLQVRLGVESRATRGWIARGGYAFETSPVPADQRGVTNLLDGNHHTIALGAGYAWGRFRVDAHVQVQVVQGRTLTKSIWDGTGTYHPEKELRDEDTDTPGVQTTNPGYPSLAGGGEVVTGGVTLEVGL
jgi:long-subunit fatty acid transport protein